MTKNPKNQQKTLKKKKETDKAIEKDKEETAGKTEPEIDYKTKFSASTREAQRLAAELKLSEATIAQEKANAIKLKEEKEEMERRFADQNPEAYDAIKTSKEMAAIKEKTSFARRTDRYRRFY